MNVLNGAGQRCLAPIVLFVYARLEHTRRTIESLLQNSLASESELFIYSDAARNARTVTAVQEVRDYLKEINGFKSVTIVERETNFGLAKSIIEGVTEICGQYGRIIVLEDDLVTSPYFLRYMNDALDMYENDDRVVSIHGYIYPVEARLPETFFLRGADCWGWATWKRGWDIFDADAKALLSKIHTSGEGRIFDFDHSYGYVEMLKQQVAGVVDSWAIRWYASAFLANKLTLYPRDSLVQNIGNDNSGTHCGETDAFLVNLAADPVRLGGIEVTQSELGYLAVRDYFRSLKIPLVKRVIKKLKSIVFRRN